MKLLRDLYDERFGKDAAKTLEQRFQIPEIGKDGKPKDDTVLDEPAFCAEIERMLTDLQPVEASELNTLALDRSTGIKNILVQTGGVDPTRIFILDRGRPGRAQGREDPPGDVALRVTNPERGRTSVSLGLDSFPVVAVCESHR